MPQPGLRVPPAPAAVAPVVLLTAVWVLSWPAGAAPDPGSGLGVGSVDVELDISRVYNKVDQRFLSISIDSSFMSQDKFMYLLRSPKLRTLAKALSPAFLRFGGTKQDFLQFVPQRDIRTRSGHYSEGSCERFELSPLMEKRLKQDWAQQALILYLEEQVGKYKPVNFTENSVDLLYDFTNCSGLELIFGLNELFRTSENAWNSQNAELLINYCQSRQYSMSWELGNEPNSYEKKAGIRVDGDQLGRDFLHLHKILQNSKFYRTSDLYGPDISQPRDHRRDLLTGFLATAAGVINACTWHQ